MTTSLLVHLANVLFLVSYSVRDVLWLRAASVAGGALLLVYFVLQSPPLWAAIGWNLVFATLHLWHIGRLVNERRPVHLTPDEARVFTLAFRSLRPLEVRRLVAAGQVREAREGEVLCERGDRLGELLLVLEGTAEVEVDGERIVTLFPGRFVGEIAFLAGGPASARVRARAGLRYVAWDVATLRRFLDGHDAVKGALQLVLGLDVAHKLRGAA